MRDNGDTPTATRPLRKSLCGSGVMDEDVRGEPSRPEESDLSEPWMSVLVRLEVVNRPKHAVVKQSGEREGGGQCRRAPQGQDGFRPQEDVLGPIEVERIDCITTLPQPAWIEAPFAHVVDAYATQCVVQQCRERVFAKEGRDTR
jgi:hypothetical protein